MSTILLRKTAETRALFFAIFLCLACVLCAVLAYTNTSSIVLGTEMNANGMIEYLCLGNACENLTDFHWID